MKLLFDENLSWKLVQAVATVYPASAHVSTEGLRGADDQKIWNHCRDHEYTIVSKDTDFRERSIMEGFPPKVIWLDVGNSGTQAIGEMLIRERSRVEAFLKQTEASFLILSLE